jgi:F420-non-reducing hydrogenase iron-sulfur subunit
MGNLLEHMGIEKDRVHFSWISSAEATKFVDVVKEISAKVRALGPNEKLVKDYK